MREKQRDLQERDLTVKIDIPRNTIQPGVDDRDSILERLVKSIGKECGQEASEYLANSRAEATGE